MAVPPFQILVPRLVDSGNTNAQNLNAKAMLARFRDPRISWHAFHYNAPDPGVAANPRIILHRLWRRHLWPWHILSHYLRRYDAVFYPGNEWFDARAMSIRHVIGRREPVIATMEGIPGDSAREALLAAEIGHSLFCDPKPPHLIESFDAARRRSDHIIAISPFLGKVADALYGKGHSLLPLGIEPHFLRTDATQGGRPVIVSVGRVQGSKRPEVFFTLAARFPDADFVWYGDGPSRAALIEKQKAGGLSNLSFPGALPPESLAGKLREASLFVLPSHSEGVPKASQEAAACGLPLILFGFYEPPSVRHGENGYLVSDDDELATRVGELLNDPAKRQDMGVCSRRLAEDWNWDRLAPLWQAHVLSLIRGGLNTAPPWVTAS